MFYTIGQRKGLGIGGLNNGKDGGWYVADKDITNNELIAVQGRMHPALYHTKLLLQMFIGYLDLIQLKPN